MIKQLKSNRGEGTYIDTVIFVLKAVLFISFALNIFSIISAKQQMDICADQLTRQIQLSGEVNEDTESLFSMICGKIGSVKDVQYTVDTTYYDGKKIQLGTPFKVTVTATAYLGGYGDLFLAPIELVSTAAGVSEEYWK